MLCAVFYKIMNTLKWLQRKYPNSFEELNEYFDRHEIENFKKSTIKKVRSHRFWLGGVMCRLFHHIRAIENCKFIDRVDGREVGQYECCRCNKRFMANSKRSWFRVYN